MEIRCKKCGRPLHDPTSIARGMGPGCAGIVMYKRNMTTKDRSRLGASYPSTGETKTAMIPYTSLETEQNRLSEVFALYPPELVRLVLSAPAPGSIASWLQQYSGSEKQPMFMIKAIRRTCIEHRLIFWPGLFMNQQPIACIPCGVDYWKFGEKGVMINKAQLVGYLSRYGMIAQEQQPKSG